MLVLSTLVAGAWGIGLAAATRAQARLIFGAPRTRRSAPPGPHAGHRTSEVRLSTVDGMSLQGWLTLPAQSPEWLAVWFGGRNEDVGWAPAIASWLGPSWAVCAFNYRGCAGSSGSPGEAACVQDAMAILQWATAATGVPADKVLLLGRSLGSCIAVQGAARTHVAGLVLLSPPASLRRLMVRNPLLLPATPWLKHRFDSLAAAPRVRAPSLVLLAERDGRVPLGDSRLLARALHASTHASTARLNRVATIPGTDHRSLPRHRVTLAAISEFAGRLGA